MRTSTVSVSQNLPTTGPAWQKTDQHFHVDSDFIRHPTDYPLALQVFSPWQRWRSRQRSARKSSQQSKQGLGLIFEHSRYLRPGSWLELSIPMRDSCERFHGRVVMVRETVEAYEIGLQILNEEQSSRLRIVEQFCYMACYCRNIDCAGEKPGYVEFGQSDNHEQQARHWVKRFAAAFPSPQPRS